MFNWLIFSIFKYKKTATTKAENGCFKLKILNELKLKLNDEKFINKSRLLLSSFTRVRRLPFEAMVLFIIEKTNAPLSVCLSSFFSETGYIPTKSSFSQARSFLCFKVFKRLNLWVVNKFYRQCAYEKWKGHRVLSIDGSTLSLPDHPSMADKFSRHAFGAKNTVKHWMSRVSFLYDVLNNVVIDAQMERFSTSEAALCDQHLGFLTRGDLVIFDRYYASHYLFSVLMHKKVQFLFRMRAHSWKCVKSFIDSGVNDQVVELKVNPYSKVAKKIPANVSQNITVRLVKQVTKSGEVRVYATSLVDQQTYSRNSIINLYKKRWGVEEAYKTLKARLDVIHFSGKTVKAVQQDFYANVFLISLTSIMKADIKPVLTTKKQTQNKDKRIPIINNTYALSQVKTLLKKTCIAFDYIQKWIDVFNRIVKSAIEYSRRGQTNKRKKNKGQKIAYAQNYKTI